MEQQSKSMEYPNNPRFSGEGFQNITILSVAAIFLYKAATVVPIDTYDIVKDNNKMRV
ncbi:hypothetical protein [Desulfosporosinus orientis]|uniref:hypothetical protein n=1 Tax=Desulfosporosinus orientis TaxID=1563 RepID=UPI001305216C|nr:hypothetical protein [Desulfosporosinus orientis]